MSESQNYLELNKDSWNKRVDHHMASDFYEVPAFLDGKNSLKEIELALLGDVKGKSLLHLQCHFGQDTLSLARMGAKATGVDFSEQAIDQAKKLNAQLGLDAQFICSDVYAFPEVREQHYDMVFTSYGTIGWLPDLKKWADVVAGSLKPGGRFVFAEFHPYVWMFDDNFTKLEYSYFNIEDIEEDVIGTYTDTKTSFKSKTISWNHPFSEVINALLKAGMSLESLSEYDFSPYDCFPDTVEIAPGKFQIKGMDGKLPMVYALTAVKKG